MDDNDRQVLPTTEMRDDMLGEHRPGTIEEEKPPNDLCSPKVSRLAYSAVFAFEY